MSEAGRANGPEGASTQSRRLISASAVMVAGTLLSRIMGFGRFALLVFLFGNATRQADMFAVANTVPNSMYILLAGGVLNTVLVPQIVRAIKTDRDGGEAYTNRILTGGLIVLFAITLVLTLAVPLIIDLYTAGGWKSPALAPQYHSMVALGYYCMPQVFFYGVHVLVGQVLNARDRFGPMMWAPIANNVISIVVLLIFAGTFGRTDPGRAFTPGQELLLGIGATVGIAAQAAVLIPYLRSVGFTFHPRFDFRGTGLGRTVSLAKWTLGFVLVTQVALVVVNKVATAATVDGAGGGLAAYANAYAIWILPHSLITVSLATAMLPSASRLAQSGDLSGTAAEVTRTIRLALSALLPASVGMCVLALPATRLVFGFGAGADDSAVVGWALMAFAVGLVPFTVQYLALRAFYALENTRTPFFLQVLISGLNIGLGIGAVLALRSDAAVAAGLAVGFSLAYVVGAAASLRRLQRDLPDLGLRDLVRLCVRLLLATLPAAALAGGLVWWVEAGRPGQGLRAATLAGAGLLAVAVFVAAARALHIAEVAEIVGTVLRRGGGSVPPEAAPTPGRPEVPADSGDSTLVSDPAALRLETAAVSHPTAGATQDSTQDPDAMATLTPAHSPAQPSADAHALTPIPPETVGPPPGSLRPPRRSQVLAGTVLAGRYRLEELLAETPRIVSWRAFDQVLSRSVLVHLLAPHDPDAEQLLTLARQSAVATDSRFLRVLDAVPSDDDEIGSYVVCEYAVGQSLELVLSHGPLTGLEAGWLVREVADAMQDAHALGLYHQRLSPDTIVLTPDGHVKIVGLVIEAALRQSIDLSAQARERTAEQRDVLDLGRLLYACLVSRWPGGPAYSLPAAPATGHGWLSPRQVRAGVSPALDDVCDQILGEPPRHREERLGQAGAVAKALAKVLGPADASGDLERRLRQPVPQVRSTLPPVGGLSGAHAHSPMSANGPRITVVRHASATEAARTPGGQPREQDQRSRRWLIVLLVMAMVLVGTAVTSAVLLNRTPSAGPSTTAPTGPADPTGPPASTTPSAAPLRIVSARVFDPQGDPPNDENNDEASLAFDGDTDTRWRTVTYRGNPELGGIKRGVGLVLDLGRAEQVNAVSLRLSGNDTDLQIRVPAEDAATVTRPPLSSDRQWRRVGSATGLGGRGTVELTDPVQTRFVLVYLTSLPRDGSGYRGGIAEVGVS